MLIYRWVCKRRSCSLCFYYYSGRHSFCLSLLHIAWLWRHITFSVKIVFAFGFGYRYVRLFCLFLFAYSSITVTFLVYNEFPSRNLSYLGGREWCLMVFLLKYWLYLYLFLNYALLLRTWDDVLRLVTNDFRILFSLHSFLNMIFF